MRCSATSGARSTRRSTPPPTRSAAIRSTCITTAVRCRRRPTAISSRWSATPSTAAPARRSSSGASPIHNSHYGLIQDNVVYNYNGSSIATEDGSESFNVFDHNFALRGMGEPNNSVSEARSAMGTEGVGFWFRGPNNYVRNNVAANFQNPTTEAAYGFVYQFIRLGNVATPNFKGADPAVAGQFTTRNGNNMPILQFENNEAYGAMQGGFTYWWVGSQDPQPAGQRAGEPDQEPQDLARLQQGRLSLSVAEDHVRRLDHPGQVRLLGAVLRQRRLLRGLFDQGHHHSQFGYSRHGRGDCSSRRPASARSRTSRSRIPTCATTTTFRSRPMGRSTAAGCRTSWW